MKIFLIGLPGSGKSTLGKEIAASLQIPFVDLDAEIEGTAGKDIKTIFKEKGEDYFRHVESDCLRQWTASARDFVMATGGGAPCFFDNMANLNKSGTTVFLDVPPAEVVRRINRTERAERPLLGRVHHDELKDHVQRMRTLRLSFYSQAQFIVSGVKITGTEVLNLINGKKEIRPLP
jgi:shikimate kinase